MFQREKKAGFPFILVGLFDPEGLGAAALDVDNITINCPQSLIL
ncbi:hypothetical protein [Rossellomorea aquimaris]|nr:hypothetical protein [Rossellomorea aquimaris]